MGAAEVEAFLTNLAVEANVAAATQNLALSAILFLYREVLELPLPWLDSIERAKKPARLPTVLTQTEVAAVLGRLDGTAALMLRLLYGTGMRLMECVRLRVKDVDFAMRQITVRDGNGGKDRVTMLPDALARKYPGAPGSWGWQYVFPARGIRSPRICWNRGRTSARCRNCWGTRT